MAIDTVSKRRSVVQMIAIQTMPLPSGTIGASARENATWLYGGIAAQVFTGGGRCIGDLFWSRNEQ